MKQVSIDSLDLQFFPRKQAEKILQYFLMPFKAVPKKFNEKTNEVQGGKDK